MNRLPPIGMLRWAIRSPLVTTTSVASTPIDTSTIDGGGSSGSIVVGSGSWSNITMFASAIGASWRTSTSMPASSKGVRALATCSFFMAKRATSASMTNPPSSIPTASRCQSQTTWSSGNGICWPASYLTMSGIFLASTGGSLMNFDRPDWPGADTATRSPARSWREVNSVRAARTSSTGLASSCVSIIGYSMHSISSVTSRRGSVGETRQRSALRLLRPISIPQTYGLAGIVRMFPVDEGPDAGRIRQAGFLSFSLPAPHHSKTIVKTR